MDNSPQYYAFAGDSLIQQGPLAEVALALKNESNHTDTETVLVFEGASGRQLDLDLRGTEADIASRYALTDAQVAAGADSGTDSAAGNANVSGSIKSRGRPRLGVVGREVTLLPRHWAWLDQQRGGSSAALRRLVENARRETEGEDRIRQSQDSANRFMVAIAGNLPGFEEAVRALYGQDKVRFESEVRNWPSDIRACARAFAKEALD